MKRFFITTLFASAVLVTAQTKPRARDLGVPFEGQRQRHNRRAWH